MKTIILVVIIFSVLLLIPLGYQSVFAGAGTGIPISTTSLLLAGLDSNYSILMALAVIGLGAFGALYYSTKKKSEESSD